MKDIKDAVRDLPFIEDLLEHRPKVAVLRLSGVIADSASRKGGLCYDRYAPLIEKAFTMKDVREVALAINSPGGAPAQCSLMSGMIRYFAAEKQVPVSAFVEDVAASGGYWLACAADKIYVQPSSIVGSIGVISAGFGFEDFIAHHHIKRRLHTAGKDKSMLDPFTPEKTKDISRLKDIQASLHSQFIGWVKERRGARLQGADTSLFEGQIFTGTEGLANGLADAVGDVHGVMRDKYGPKVRMIAIEPERPWFQNILSVKGASPLASLPDEVLAAIENRLDWQRMGL